MRTASTPHVAQRASVLLAILGLVASIALTLSVVSPQRAAAATACAAAWSSSSVYTGGAVVSQDGKNWRAGWWTTGEKPGSTGEWGVWRDQGACGGTSTPTPTTTPTTTPKPTVTPTPTVSPTQNPGSFVVSKAQFEQMFPNRNAFYTYEGLVEATKSYPAFATTGGTEIAKREAAAFLANVDHETGGLRYITEINTANYPHYCDPTQPFGCPAGQAMYYGRGPIQLSWNYNYKAAGDALGIDLLNNPNLVQTDPAVAMATGLWYWNTQTGPGTMTGHAAIVNNRGFGETIRSINGSLECNGGNTAQVNSRVASFQRFTQILGTTTGSNLTC
ncbi:putative chitinase [Sediminihabitans luteus]|uniref:Putative chitinase n=1 Tax=Sediminihabitans luteus TaxID=1138585 RepID=A0A2M9CYB7_9CELL|nr:glycoside hydrolase family 19 protein [Sediminihabitans luteus]PJJ76887.1 putative chitinase [Sediminihabitans luteus]GII99528.1 hypothetical protein Slu03_19060 [Sediminihabitans luteus]